MPVHDFYRTFPTERVQMFQCFSMLHGEAGGNALKGARTPSERCNPAAGRKRASAPIQSKSLLM